MSEPPNNYFHPEFERNKDDSAIGVCEWDLYASHEYEKYKIRRNVEYFLLPATRDVSVFRAFMQELSEIAIASDSVTLLNQLREFRYTKRSALSPRTLTEEEKVESERVSEQLTASGLGGRSLGGQNRQAVALNYNPLRDNEPQEVKNSTTPVVQTPLAATPGRYSSSQYTNGPQFFSEVDKKRHQEKLTYFREVNQPPLGHLKFFDQDGLPLLHYAIGQSAWKCAEYFIKKASAENLLISDSNGRSVLAYAREMRKINSTLPLPELDKIIGLLEQKTPANELEIKQENKKENTPSLALMLKEKTRMITSLQTKTKNGIWSRYQDFKQSCDTLQNEKGLAWEEIKKAIEGSITQVQEKGVRKPTLQKKIESIPGFIQQYEREKFTADEDLSESLASSLTIK
ncbi:hypothetical protein AYO24_00100 [Coxiella burnetii]|nr:hypothetical protein COXBURSA331_A0024 [Coxiella burnetii RSA 331]ATN81228.1 hypothetical protein AYO24_00100 [Coxiella burnetii]ATN83131.1 hypothetical protein AYO23_00100 [Coxiella burnetii]POZ80033.1 hypothetical protein CbuRSA461_00095 [Coxiella burnetii]